ncbi:hypothetical protein Vretimale_16501 [Volvox reticuliferus]|uniref:Vacuolar protein 14 C-terminal Fig4-binding domain-containing protein n=1 Tax=Volvox reticuliferus TaxID=1737510 RepID=A0A8J4LXF2_9CHLO|nr:hypothetical protein Vretifemale_17574 [Volvox reticuliferus]GIM13446.1 hypothetical protein Vretimale_16501 [Volvox reticuliferus]
MVASDELLPAAVLRQIGDKLYEKRKFAALDVEQLIKRLAAQNDQHRIRLIIDKLISEYSFSSQANHRKGALLCLAAAAVGLGEPTEVHLRQIVPPVLASFTDQDARVRYYACEALYNIAKVARSTFILFFNEVFDAMFRLCADSEANVQNAVQFLDALIKDIAADCTNFEVAAFIPKLRDYLRVTNPHKRQFLLSWVEALDSMPNVKMLPHLPALMDGLLSMLAEPVREVRTTVAKCLKDFLAEVRDAPEPELTAEFFGRLTATVVDRAGSPDELTRLTSIHWLRAFVELAPDRVLSHVPAILGVVLYNISSHNVDIQRECAEANAALLRLDVGVYGAAARGAAAEGGGIGVTAVLGARAAVEKLDIPAILGTVILEMRSEMEATRLEALRWLHFLLARAQELVLEQVGRLLPPLLDSLSAPSDAVVTSALGVLAALADCPGQFNAVLVAFLDRFRGEAGFALLQRSGSSLVRRLCSHLGAAAVLPELGAILQRDTDMSFAATMVSVLNLILLTGPELAELRDQLRRAAVDPAGAKLFTVLYPSWCYSAGALLSLCFVAQAYDHAVEIVHAFADLPFGAELLVQIDRLVALLETPCFTFLRLQLLEPRKHPALLRALYGLLMLLPQCNAFRMLNARLQAVPTLELLQLEGGLGPTSGSPHMHGVATASEREGDVTATAALATKADWAGFPELLRVFRAAQLRQYEAYVEQRRPQPLMAVGTAGPGVTFAASVTDRPTTLSTADKGGVQYVVSPSTAADVMGLPARASASPSASTYTSSGAQLGAGDSGASPALPARPAADPAVSSGDAHVAAAASGAEQDSVADAAVRGASGALGGDLSFSDNPFLTPPPAAADIRQLQQPQPAGPVRGQLQHISSGGST